EAIAQEVRRDGLVIERRGNGQVFRTECIRRNFIPDEARSTSVRVRRISSDTDRKRLMKVSCGNVRSLVGIERAGPGPAKRQQPIVFQLIIAAEKTGRHRTLNVQVQLFIDLNLVLSRDRQTYVLLRIPKEMLLIILRTHARN